MYTDGLEQNFDKSVQIEKAQAETKNDLAGAGPESNSLQSSSDDYFSKIQSSRDMIKKNKE